MSLSRTHMARSRPRSPALAAAALAMAMALSVAAQGFEDTYEFSCHSDHKLHIKYSNYLSPPLSPMHVCVGDDPEYFGVELWLTDDDGDGPVVPLNFVSRNFSPSNYLLGLHTMTFAFIVECPGGGTESGSLQIQVIGIECDCSTVCMNYANFDTICDNCTMNWRTLRCEASPYAGQDCEGIACLIERLSSICQEPSSPSWGCCNLLDGYKTQCSPSGPFGCGCVLVRDHNDQYYQCGEEE